MFIYCPTCFGFKPIFRINTDVAGKSSVPLRNVPSTRSSNWGDRVGYKFHRTRSFPSVLVKAPFSVFSEYGGFRVGSPHILTQLQILFLVTHTIHAIGFPYTVQRRYQRAGHLFLRVVSLLSLSLSLPPAPLSLFSQFPGILSRWDQDASLQISCSQWCTEGGFGVFKASPPTSKFRRPSKIVLNSTRL